MSTAGFGLNGVDRTPRRRGQNIEEQDVPPAVTGPNIVELNVPDRIRAGSDFTVTGRIHFNNLSRPLTETPVRVQVRGPSIQTVEQELGGMSHCNERTFSLSATAAGQPGDTLAVTVESQSKPLGSWTPVETQGPLNVQLRSTGGTVADEAISLAPWAIGGGAVGLGAAMLTGQPIVPGGAIGVGAGIGLRALTGTDGIGQIIPDFPVVPVAVTGGTLLAGAILVGQITGD